MSHFFAKNVTNNNYFLVHMHNDIYFFKCLWIASYESFAKDVI